MTPAECPTIEISSDTTYLEVASDPTGYGLSPMRLPHAHFRCQWQGVGPQVTHNFCPTWLQIRGSHNPLLGPVNLLERLTELPETHLPVCYTIRDRIKDTDNSQTERHPG